MQTFFFDMKDGVPMRGRGVSISKTTKELAQHFRDGSPMDIIRT
jgi:hypothetical protein